MHLERLLIGLACSAAIGLFALRRGSLSRSGALAALVIGTTIYAGGGGSWFLALLAFFTTSTLLGKVGKQKKERIKLDFEKGDTRDAWQAFSNGGVAAACALGMLLWPHAAWMGGFIGALATANGDTWATELGTLSRAEPWSLRSLRRVPRGTSGAVSPLGLVATALGGLLIGLVVGSSQGLSPASLHLWAIGLFTGVLGSLADSLLGASVQAAYRCEACASKTEGTRHHCGAQTVLVSGFAWFDNDLVNLSATALGALAGAASVTLLG